MKKLDGSAYDTRQVYIVISVSKLLAYCVFTALENTSIVLFRRGLILVEFSTSDPHILSTRWRYFGKEVVKIDTHSFSILLQSSVNGVDQILPGLITTVSYIKEHTVQFRI